MNAFTLTGEFLLKGDKEAISSIDNIDKKAGGLGGAFANAGKVAAIGLAAVTTVAVAVGGAVVSMTKDAIGFEKQMAEVFTLLPGITKEAMDSMNADVLDFAKNMGVLPDKVVPALYQAISAGVPKDNVFDFLETAQKAAIGGVTALETAVDGISSVVNAYGADIIDAGKTSDLMFTAVRLGKTTFEELSASLFQVIPTASALGVRFEDVTAAIAAMTAQGTPTSVATTQMRQMLVELSKEGGKTSDTFKEISGQSFKDFIASGGGVADALELMKGHADENNIGLNDMFSSVEAGNAALALGGKGAETYGANLREMNMAAGATDAAFETMETTGARAMEKIMAGIETMKIQFGQEFLPVFKDVLMPLISGTIIPLFASLLEKIKPIAVKLVELVPVLVDKLAPAFLSLVDVVGGTFIDIFAEIVKNVLPPLIDLFEVIVSKILPPFMKLFGEIVSRILPPFMEIFGIIVEKILPPFLELFTVIIEKVLPPFMDLFMILVDTILPPLIEFFAMLVETIMPPFIEIIELVMEILKPFIDLFAELMAAILPPLMDLFTQLVQAILPPLLDILKLIIEYAIKPLLDLFGKLIEWAMPYLIMAIEYLANVIIPAIINVFADWHGTVEKLKLFFETLGMVFQIIWNAIKEYFINLWNDIKQAFLAPIIWIGETIFTKFNEIKTNVELIWNGVRDFFIGIWDSIMEKVDAFKEKFVGAWNFIKDGVKGAINSVIGFINRMIDGLESGINSIVHALNRINFEIPSWVPKYGGEKFGLSLREVNLPSIPQLASGGIITSPGYALVGEQGPELLRLPAGAQVEPLGKSSGINIEQMNITSPKPLTESEIKRQLDLLSRELGYRLGMA